jgi:hypothetical protein
MENTNNYLDIINNMMNALFDMKEKISDNEYKTQLEDLAKMRKIYLDSVVPNEALLIANKKIEDLENTLQEVAKCAIKLNKEYNLVKKEQSLINRYI